MNNFLDKHKKSLISFTKLIIFIVIFSSLFVKVSYLFRPIDGETMGLSGFYEEKENTMDVMYVGGSICITAWLPYNAWESNGITSCAFGKSSMLANSVEYVIKEAEKTQNPELYIIDLRPFQYTLESYEGKHIRALSNTIPYSKNRTDLINASIDYVWDMGNQIDKMSYYVDFLLYHGEIESFKKNTSVKHQKNSNFSSKGFFVVIKHNEIKEVDNSKVYDSVPVSKNAENSIKELMTYLNENNKKALFVVTPYEELEEHRAQYNYLKEIIIENGFDYFNANEHITEIGIDVKRDFYDPAHMNIFGAEKYTKYLSEYISKKYDLEDRRNNPKYSYWNDDLKEWKKIQSTYEKEIENLIAEKKQEK